MTTFVRLVPADRDKLEYKAMSPEVLEVVRRTIRTPVAGEAVKVLLQHLLQHDDLWYEDALALHPAAAGAFLALKLAFQAEHLVAYDIPEATSEEDHLINMLKKHGYWPWY